MVSGISVSFAEFLRITRVVKSDNFIISHGEEKPLNRNFGYFSRPLLGDIYPIYKLINKNDKSPCNSTFCLLQGDF